MTILKRNADVRYSAAQMYDLVNAIEDYPEFLPWCSGSEVLSRTEDEVQATLHLSRGGISKSFTTCNRLQKHKMMEVRLVKGPFRQLEGFWRFEDLGEQGGSRVSFDLEFEFHNKLLDMAFGPVFHQVMNTLVDSFCQRAETLYGTE